MTREMWDWSIRQQADSPYESSVFNAEGLAQESSMGAIDRYIKYLDEGGMEEIKCSRKS